MESKKKILVPAQYWTYSRKKVYHSKEHEIWIMKQHSLFTFSFYFYAIPALEEHGNTNTKKTKAEM
jgi:hypothetical protein